MANITEEHLHHMARRHHATMQKLDGLRERYAGVTGRLAGTVEFAAGAWLGGTLEGRTAGAALGPIPYNLGAGIALLGVSHFALAKEESLGAHRWGEDVQNLGNGLVGSWAAATGYAFGKRWKESGKAFGGGGQPWSHPYENGWSRSAPLGPPVGPPAGAPLGPPVGPPGAP